MNSVAWNCTIKDLANALLQRILYGTAVVDF